MLRQTIGRLLRARANALSSGRLAGSRGKIGASATLALIAGLVLTIGLAPILPIRAPTAPVSPAREIPAAAKKRILDSYAKLPMSFEVNRGQTDDRVSFLARGSGYTLFLTPTEAVLALTSRRPAARGISPISPLVKSQKAQAQRLQRSTASSVLRMKLLGSNTNPQMTGRKPLSGKSNYFIGNDPSRWRTNVQTYAEVAYRDVYPGIDVVYYGNQGQLEYDFIIAPGRDPAAISFTFEGAEDLAVDTSGDLILRTATGEVRQRRPVIYQDINGSRHTINGGYVLKAHRRVGYEIAAYDPRFPLVIDPVLVYSSFLGGSSVEFGFGIAVDGQGRAYVTGQTGSFDFPTRSPYTTPAPGGGTNTSGNHSFVTRFSATESGVYIQYSSYLGGNQGALAADIAVDTQGRAYVTGQTSSPDFPTRFPFTSPSPGGGSLRGPVDGFVVRFSPTGSALQYSSYLGGSGFDAASGIAVDSNNRAYVVGVTDSTDFPVTPGAFDQTLGGGFDVFVVRLTVAGSSLSYSSYLGGSGGDGGSGNFITPDIAVDASSRAYVAGMTDSIDFPGALATGFTDPLPGGKVLRGPNDGFVVRFNAAGTALEYASYLGGDTFDDASGIAVDNLNRAYVVGITESINFPTKNPFTTPAPGGGTLRGTADVFVVRFNAAGTALEYASYLGGSGRDQFPKVAVGPADYRAHVTGLTDSTDFPIANPLSCCGSLNGFSDVFVARFSAAGSALEYSTYLGGSSNEGDFFDVSIAVIAGTVHGKTFTLAYVTGTTTSSDFPTRFPYTSPAPGGGTLRGDQDAFVTIIGH